MYIEWMRRRGAAGDGDEIMKTPKYTQNTVQKFMSYLNEIGLSVHGNYMEGNKEFHGLMDYNSADIVNRRKHIQAGTIDSSERNHD